MEFSITEFSILDYVEGLTFEKGKFLLRIEADQVMTKILTPEEAEDWYKKRFPSYSWESIEKQIAQWKPVSIWID